MARRRLALLLVLAAAIAAGSAQAPTAAQTESVISQFTSSARDSYAGSISGDGRFVVFESSGNLATENPRNADGNSEIFLWDFAQRRIFQITDTKPVQKNTFGNFDPANIKVDIVNKRPVISQNGRWIAFASNATAATVAVPDSSNPGSFTGNDYNTQAPPPCTLPSPTPTPSPTATPTPSSSPTPTPSPTSTPFNNPLQCDANLEVWLYEIPAYGPADLHSGDEIPVTQLSGGTFSPVTNSVPSRLPLEGGTGRQPFVADDNHDVDINDDGRAIVFVSTRDLVPPGNSEPAEDAFNDEIFTFVQGGVATGAEVQAMEPAPGTGKRNGQKTAAATSYAGWSPTGPSATAAGVISQVTRTPRGTISNPIYSKNPVISGNGLRVAFASTGDNPIIGMTGGNNPLASRNEEIFVSDLDANGAPTGLRRQITVTTPTNPGDVVNLFDYGKRMSRNGRYIAFDSYADLTNESGGANQAGFATFVYDVDTNTFRRVLARSNADAAATGGDVPRYPAFTDYDGAGDPATLVLETRMNILPSGAVATTASEGLNNDAARPVQIYTYPLDVAPSAATFSRITRFPISTQFLAQTRPLTSDTSQRIAFNLSLTELGGGNADLLSEVFYLYVPTVTSSSSKTLGFATGASALPIIPTTSSSPAPTPSPTPTPTGSPSPTPVTPAAVQGASPGMLAMLNSAEGFGPAITPRSVTGSVEQAPDLPIELSGVSMTINGYGVGMKSVDNNRITFVVPPGIASALTGTSFPVVVNNQGTQIKGFITIVPARPDIFSSVLGPGGRAQALNVTNRVHTTEPFTVRTIRTKGGTRVPTEIRLRVTGVQGVPASAISIRIGNTTISGAQVLTGGVLAEPGVYTIDFQLPQSLSGAGDQPIIVTVTSGTTTFTSRLDDTAPRIAIL